MKTLFVVAGFAAGALVFLGFFTLPAQAQYACTADAMQCPDGSWVGRSGPNCQFVCPGASSNPPYVAPSYPYYPRPSGFCPSLTHNLYYGLSDYQTAGQVSRLQYFLGNYFAAEPVPVTGYFGSVTAGFVARFQREQNVYPSSGGVGPLTRAAIERVCGGQDQPPQTQGTLSAYPLSGQTPLTVSFSAQAQAGSYTLEFGDGASTQLSIPSIMCITYPCNPPAQSTSHTYYAAGTYTARLLYQPAWSCPSGQFCATVMPQPTVLATAVITVYGQPWWWRGWW